MDILLNVEAVSSPHNVTALRQLYEANIRGLNALGVTHESYGSLLAPVFMKKLPQELKLIVSHKVSGEWNIEPLMKILAEELETRERMATTHKETNGRHSKEQPTTAT